MRKRVAARSISFDVLESRFVLDRAVGALPLVLGEGRPAGTVRMADATLWPPADTPLPRSDGWGLDQHRQNVARANQGGIDVLFLGDSITYDWGDTGRPGMGSQVWSARIAPLGAANFGLPSDLTQNVLWQVEDGELAGKPKAVVVLIGTNNLGGIGQSPQETAAGITAIIEQIRILSPQSKVLFMGIFPRGPTPDDPLRMEVDKTNSLVANLGDGQSVRYINIGWRLMEFDGTIPRAIMLDYLHLNVQGYKIWADALQNPLEEILGQATSNAVTFSADSQTSGHSDGASGVAPTSLGLISATPPGLDVPVVLVPNPWPSTDPLEAGSLWRRTGSLTGARSAATQTVSVQA